MGNQGGKAAGGKAGRAAGAPERGRMMHADDDRNGGRKAEEDKASLLNRKAMAYMQSGLHQEAADTFQESLKIRTMLSQEGSSEHAMTLHNLGIAKSKLGHPDARQVLAASLLAMEKLELNNTLVYANALANEARHLVQLEDLEGAVRNYERSLAIHEQLHETTSANYWETQRAFAGALVHVNPARAATLCESIAANARQDNIFRGRVLVCWAMAERASGKQDAAIARLHEAVALFNKHDPHEATWLTRKKAAPFLAEAEEMLKSWHANPAEGGPAAEGVKG